MGSNPIPATSTKGQAQKVWPFSIRELMPNQVFITEHVIQPKDIAPAVNAIENAIDGFSREVCIIAMLSMCVMMQNPEVTNEDLQRIVGDTSRYICMVMDPPNPEVMN